MSNIKVSVIIPIYNSAPYLRQCLDSVLAQTLQEIEIICVDDGSTDECPQILAEYAAKDSRVIVLHQKNQFAGTARNYGMTVATGAYYAFWDSDDFFKPKALELMYNRCERDNADLCICSASHYFEDIGKLLPNSGYLNKKYLPKKMPFNRTDIPDHILNFATAHPWNKLFRRKFIESMDLTFHTTPNGNDIFFVINCIARAERITILDKPLICYRVNQPRSQYGAANKTPLNPINNWLVTRESLIAHDAYPKRSFDNKILGTLLFFLHNMRSWDAFLSTFLYIQQTVLPQMEITLQEDEDYYYNKNHAICLWHLLSDTPEEFLVFFSHMTYKQLNEKKGRVQTLSQKSKKLQASVKELKATIDDQAGTIKRHASENAALTKKIDAITHSASYRIGRALTAVPRKLLGR